jgi:hypothetical protein
MDPDRSTGATFEELVGRLFWEEEEEGDGEGEEEPEGE